MNASINTLSFTYATIPGGALAVAPCIDGRLLTELVKALDEDGIAGTFGGLVPEYFNYGPLDAYFAGRGHTLGDVPGHIYVLGCECGEVGCNPVTAVVTMLDETVLWSQLTGWDTPLAMGPFQFDRPQYESAVRELVTRLATGRAS
ncbi:MAG: hypothetical protein Q7J28_05840 [Caulobacter sp.]|nr:hypothetical protein [Caulobacter sp.]